VLILGVYFGHDIVFMLDASRRAGCRIEITGVDKFSDDACADWPEALRDRSWAPGHRLISHWIWVATREQVVGGTVRRP
jgi:hypothetical protein